MQLGLSERKVYKVLWDMRKSNTHSDESQQKRILSEEITRPNEFDSLVEMMGIDVDSMAQAIVEMPSPRATRVIVKRAPEPSGSPVLNEEKATETTREDDTPTPQKEMPQTQRRESSENFLRALIAERFRLVTQSSSLNSDHSVHQKPQLKSLVIRPVAIRPYAQSPGYSIGCADSFRLPLRF